VASFREKEGRCLHCSVLEDESRDERRIVLENASFTGLVPHFARFPYEVQIYARRHVASLPELTPAEASDLAAIIRAMRRKYDRLFGFPLPLMMALQQSWHFYVEFLPIQRSPEKLKYLAAVESTLGTFLNDVVPEEAAAALRKAPF
jgi:UDPglucose--hexose-1-phosphate uridylyltransferase